MGIGDSKTELAMQQREGWLAAWLALETNVGCHEFGESDEKTSQTSKISIKKKESPRSFQISVRPRGRTKY